ncbi:hypothetical protein [Streptomyces sp. G-G2]|uniref:hypothetical protein n=1 Tax=Streptomyces sp. G-G2 TaxID=3046201 RepID=UPI0024B89EB2|nr:hypothetical protein [Streptomyces sp. G-G2]MDJ0384154.1 hypothetical protein [Streptomyces sp. G-G2]
MSTRKAMAAMLLGLTLTLTACGGAGNQRITMDDQQAITRAEEIAHQALGAMSPKPLPKRDGRYGVGACLADSGPSEREQVHISYRLEGVPGSVSQQLVRQARDAWVAQGYKFKTESGDGDWSKPDPYVSMRTVPDDFWMELEVSVRDKATGDGVAYITVTSPCYFPKSGKTASPPPRALSADDASQQRVLAHSSRIYDALRVPHAPSGATELRTVEDDSATYVHHAWATAPLTEDRAARAMARARAYFEGSGWRVRTVPSRMVALHPADEVVAQLAPGHDGALLVGITGPAVAVLRAEA